MEHRDVEHIRNAWVCRVEGQAMHPVFGHLHLDGGRIRDFEAADFRVFLGERPPAGASARQGGGARGGAVGEATIDADGRVLTVPLVNFHDHLYSRLARGLSLPGPTHDFAHVLESFWWRLDSALDEAMLAAGARLGALEALRCGVGYLFDHHCSPGFIEGSLDCVGGALAEAGLRGVLCFETSDRNGAEAAHRCLQENRRFLKALRKGRGAADLRGLLGLHACFTLSEETLRAASQLGAELEAGIHIHAAEDRVDEEHSRSRFGESVVRRLQRHGLLERPGVLAHGVHLDDEELDLVAASTCALALNPDSNLNNAVGLAPLRRLAGTGVCAVPGTDGMHASPGRSFKQLFLLARHQGATVPESFAWAQRLYFDQLGFVRRFFPDFPSLAAGDRADLTVWDYRPPSPLGRENSWGHWVHGLLEAPAWALLGGGRALLREAAPVGVDAGAVGREAARQGERLFERLGVNTSWPT